MDSNESHINCVKHIKIFIQKYLLSSADLLRTEQFSILSAKNRHFVYNSTIFFISVEYDPIFLRLKLKLIFTIA